MSSTSKNTFRNRAIGFARQLKFHVLIRTISAFDFLLNQHTIGADTTIWVKDGDIGLGSRSDLCVFAHFDPANDVDDYVVNYLACLAENGFEIIFCSTTQSLPDTAIRKIAPFCCRIIKRENRGYDFASWKIALDQIPDLKAYETLLIANDSVYGPLKDISSLIKRMRQAKYDFWGITDSYEGYRHAQSYFIFLEKSVFTSAVFKKFWERLPLYRAKVSIIWRNEIGLSKRLSETGFEMGSFCDYKSLRKEYPDVFNENEPLSPTQKLNTSHVLWRRLIEKHACPFLKVGIVRNLPENSIDINEWESVVDEYTTYDKTLIQNHLDRIQRKSDE